jgi:hypothetical protein
MKKLGFQNDRGSTLIPLNAGLMKPREGFTPVTGNKNWGWAKYEKVALPSFSLSYERKRELPGVRQGVGELMMTKCPRK